MMWNAVIMLIASLGVMWGLREGVRYTLLNELDDDLQDDFGEISIALVNVFGSDNPFFHAGMDRKARGHKQRSWFLQIVDMRSPEEREAERIRQEQRRREEQARWREEMRRNRRGRNRPTPENNSDANAPAGEAPASELGSPAESSREPMPVPPPAATDVGQGDNSSQKPVEARDVANEQAANEQATNEQATKEQATNVPLPRINTRQMSAVPAANQKADNSQTSPESQASAISPMADGKEAAPRIIWQTFNVPDWSTIDATEALAKFELEEGVPTTIDQYRVVERTIKNARGGPVRVRIGASMLSIQAAADATDRMMYLNIMAALVVAPLGGYWLAVRATRPLQAMIRTSDRLRPQQMDERLPLSHTEDEIDQLSRAFNRMLDRIAEYLVKRQDLLANSAHELRTPLAALRTSAELALSSERSTSQYCEVLESIVSECGNLELLVNQLLLLSETESAHFESRGEKVDFSKITNEACDMFGAVAESRGVELKTDVASGIVVDGSRLHLRQLLNNLIDNAIKFIPGQGTVTVSLQSTGQGQQLIVRDTGVGIAENEQRRLFERFYRGDKSRRRDTPTRGTGLGLSICRAITEAHRGTISVESRPGVGTAVIVTLPVQGQKAAG